MKLERDGDPTTLSECPLGLFTFKGELCLKSEYGNNEGRIDAYIVATGELFWGDHPQTIASQRASIVQPIVVISDGIVPEPSGMSDVKAKQVTQLVQRCRPLFAGQPPEMQGAALAEMLAIWLAGHICHGDPEETARVREELLEMHIDAVRKLVRVNHNIMYDQPSGERDGSN